MQKKYHVKKFGKSVKRPNLDYKPGSNNLQEIQLSRQGNKPMEYITRSNVYQNHSQLYIYIYIYRLTIDNPATTGP